MKLAEHTTYIENKGIPDCLCSECSSKRKIKCYPNCPRCAQLSLLQQIVDDLEARVTRYLEWADKPTTMLCEREDFLSKRIALLYVIEDYKDIIEGSK